MIATADPRDAEIAKLTAENATLRADLNDARSNWESGAEELRQADLVREQLVAALKIGRDVMALVGVQDHLIDYDAVSRGRKVVDAALLAAGQKPDLSKFATLEEYKTALAAWEASKSVADAGEQDDQTKPFGHFKFDVDMEKWVECEDGEDGTPLFSLPCTTALLAAGVTP